MITTANIFEAVKTGVSVRDAAECYGIRSNHAGMACCPFHDDHTPSMKLNEDYFYCFGCGAGGDVITFTARLFNLRPYEAARKLASDFNIPVDIPLPAQNDLRTFRMDQYRCQRALDSYLNLLIRWKSEYEPTDPDEEWDERYLEACQMMEPMEYLADELAVGTLEQRRCTVERLLAGGKIDQLEERVSRLNRKEETEMR